jgi:phosphotransferase family enzyme
VSELRALDLGDVIARAAAALSRTAGHEVRLAEVQAISKEDRRNLVIRAVAHENEGKTTPVIVKATRSPDYDPAAENALQASGLVREWVATAYIGGTLLAGDVDAGILVLKDLGPGLQSLVHPLLRGTAQEAEDALTSYATALASLHTSTLDCLDRYRATFDAAFGKRRHRPIGRRVEAEAEAVVKILGHAPPADELALLTSRLRDPGPWLSLVHGDPCPDNTLIVDGHIRLIDYEWTRPSHALLDGIYWQMGFPTCWCAGRTPPDVATRVDTVYRRELGRAIPEALDQAFNTELTYMAAVWLFTGLSWRLGGALERDETWGIWSIRGRLLWYLEQVIEMTGANKVLPGLNQSAQAWLADLRGRWPETQPLGHFPAFATEAAKT